MKGSGNLYFYSNVLEDTKDPGFKGRNVGDEVESCSVIRQRKQGTASSRCWKTSFHILQNMEHWRSWKSLRIQSLKRPWKLYSTEVCWEPTHETLLMTRSWGRKPDRQGRSGFQGFRKAAPSAHLKDDTCLSDACLNGLLPNFCDTGRRPSPISSEIRINLEL